MRRILNLLGIVVLTPITLWLIFEALYFNSAYPNLQLGKIEIGGKNRSQLEEILGKEFELRQHKTLSFSVDKSKPVIITLNENILKYKTKESVNKILRYGRSGPLQQQMQQKLSLTKSNSIDPVYEFDEFTFDTMLADALRPYEQELIETNIVNQNGVLILSPSKPGRLANRTKALEQIQSYVKLQSNEVLYSIDLEDVPPKRTRENSREALILAQRAISKQLELYSPEIADQTWQLEGPELYKFLEFGYDEENNKTTVAVANYKVAEYAKQFESRVNKPPKEAKFETVGTQVVVFETSEDGRALDIDSLTNQIANNTIYAGSSTRIELPIKILKPAVTQTAVNEYGIKDLIASGTSKFTGSSAGRLHNIQVAADKINGALIKPNETFSLHRTIGDIEKATGFVDSAIIKNGRTITGIGGGVCQVSTSLFRAAINAGFPIVERSPHSYRVKYYELDGPPGLDAAIYFPGQDFRFANNTGNHILIQTKLDQNESQLTFNFYGVKDGRTVEVSQPEVLNETPPPPESRTNDASVPKGIIRQTEFAAKGATVNIKRKVTKDGQTIVDDIIRSTYRPWQAVYLIGTQEI